MNTEVKKYIDKQKPNEKELLQLARKLVLKTIAGCDEFIHYGVLCYAKGKIYLAAMKDRIHIGFSIIGLSPQEIKLFEGSGKTARHIKIFYKEELEEKNITELIKMVNQKAGIPK
jgi:hypothetical protein